MRKGQRQSAESRLRISAAKRSSVVMDEDLLRHLYQDKLFSITEIASQFGVSDEIVRNRMRLCNIPRRDRIAGLQARWSKGRKISRANSVPFSITRPQLVGLYWDKGLTVRAIATAFSVPERTVRRHMILWQIRRRTRSEAQTGTRNGFSGKHHTPVTKSLIAGDAERNRKISMSQLGVPRPYAAENGRRGATKIAERRRLDWKNPYYAKKMMTAMAARPNNPERCLGELLDAEYPNQYRYTGAGDMVIDGMIPDFTNINGVKAVIELFGDYWHSDVVAAGRPRSTEIGRIAAYQDYGFACLVVWEHELVDETVVRRKLAQFHEAISCSSIETVCM